MAAETVPHVLVVEDDEPTARMVANVLKEVDPSISTHTVPDGRDCLAVLRGDHEGVADPDIVLLDLNLIDIDGLTVLKRRADDPSPGNPPMIVVSGDDDSETIVRCYDLGANTFFAKPDDLEGYLALAESIVDYWMGHAELPSEHVPE